MLLTIFLIVFISFLRDNFSKTSLFPKKCRKGAAMTKDERRIRDFSSGMKNLGDDSRDYIHRLTNALFLVEQPPVCPGFEKKAKHAKCVKRRILV